MKLSRLFSGNLPAMFDFVLIAEKSFLRMLLKHIFTEAGKFTATLYIKMA